MPPASSTTWGPALAGPTRLLFLRRHRHWRKNANRHRRARRDDDVAAVAGHDCRGSAAAARGRADGRTLGAAENRAENRAADRAAADFRGARVTRRGAFAVDRFGADRHARAVGEDQRVEPDPEPRTVLELAAAVHFHHRTDGARAGR